MPGSCRTRCIAGHYADPLTIDACLPCGARCDIGYVSSSPTCALPHERITKPVCLACPPLQPNEVFFWNDAQPCASRCGYGYVKVATSQAAGKCQTCRPGLCGLGYYGVCVSDTAATTQLLCTPCAIMREFIVPGDCTFFVSETNNNNKTAAAPSTPAPAETIDTNSANKRGGVLHPELQYPNRTQAHSGMMMSTL